MKIATVLRKWYITYLKAKLKIVKPAGVAALELEMRVRDILIEQYKLYFLYFIRGQVP